VPRLDLPAKLAGAPGAFLHDLRPEGMVHGRVVRPPSYGARLLEVDAGPVEALPGVLKVVRDGSFLAVIAEGEWAAIGAAQAQRAAARWEERDTLPTDAAAYDWLLAAPARLIEIKDDARPAGAPAGRKLEATYRRPYQMHASVGPSVALAEMRDGKLTVHTHSQSVFETAEASPGCSTCRRRRCVACTSPGRAATATTGPTTRPPTPPCSPAPCPGGRCGCSGRARTSTPGSPTAPRW
jgi:hypothetical protein